MTDYSERSNSSPELADEDSAIVIKRTKRVQTRKAILDWTQIASNVLLPLTIGLTVFGLFQQNSIETKNATQRQVEIFYSPELNAAQVTLFSLWSEKDPEALTLGLSREVLDDYVTKAIDTSSLDRNSVTAAILALTAFFDRTEACIKSGRCNEKETLSQLGNYGRDLHCVYTGQIKAIRGRVLASRLGDGLERFAVRHGGCLGPEKPDQS